MKKNGFISISIIYSFFLVFLLLLVLTLSSYVNNRYSFNMFSKDEKKEHARRTTVAQNNKKISTLTADSDNNYFTSIYESTEGQYVNYYFYTNNPICMMCDDKKKICKEAKYEGCAKIDGSSAKMEIDDIIIILGSSDEYHPTKLSFISSNDGDLTPIGKAIKNIQGSIEEYSYAGHLTDKIQKNVLIIVPTLNSKYTSWESYIKQTSESGDRIGFNDLFKNVNLPDDYKLPKLITDMFHQINESYKNGNTIVQSTQNTRIHYIGYEQGADGLLTALSIDSLPLEGTDKIPRYYRLVNSYIQCNSADCSKINVTNLTIRKSRIQIKYMDDDSTPFPSLYDQMKKQLAGASDAFKGEYDGGTIEEKYIEDQLLDILK